MKFFIVGLHCSGKQDVINTLKEYGVKCGRLFSNIEHPSHEIYNSFNYDLFTSMEVNEIFENNAYVFINELESENINSYRYFEGLTTYEFDNNDVFVISPHQLLNISKNNINEDICFIWMDNNKEERLNRYRSEKRNYSFTNRENIEKKDMDVFVKTLYNFNNSKLLYFVNEDPNRVSTIIYTLIKHPELMEMYTKYYN